MENLDLHFTGDIHAIGAANDLLATIVEAHILHGNRVGIDPLSVTRRRCIDMNDRALRDVVVGLGGPANEKEYEPLADLLTGTPAQVVIAGKSFWGRGYQQRLAADGITLLTPDKTRRQRRPRTRPRLNPARDRKRLRQPQRPDVTRTTPRQNTRRPRRPHRATHPRAHPRHPAQHPHRPPPTRTRRLRRPLNHIKPLTRS